MYVNLCCVTKTKDGKNYTNYYIQTEGGKLIRISPFCIKTKDGKTINTTKELSILATQLPNKDGNF